MSDAAAKSGDSQFVYYYATAFAGADGAALLTEIAAGGVSIMDILSEAKLPDSRATAELKELGRDIVQTFVGGRTLGVTGKITKRPGATTYDALAAAYAAKTVFGLLVCDGPKGTVGTKCLAMNVQISEFGSEWPDPGAVTHDFAAAPTGLSAWAPASVTVAS